MAGRRPQRKGSVEKAASRPTRWYETLSREEEIELARRVRNGDREAFDRMVEANLPLVIRIARSYRHAQVPTADLIQEGNIGLIEAVERFDPDRGYRFSTYAVWWIRKGILRALANHSRMIRLPDSALTECNRIARATANLRNSLGREPSSAEIAEQLAVSVERVEFYQTADAELVSLDAPPSETNGRRFDEVLEDPSQDPDEWIERLAIREQVERLLARLNPRERSIVRMRFGIDDGRPMTLRETGQRLNLTRERVRQIEAHVLDRLRAQLAAGSEGSEPGQAVFAF